MFFTSKSLKSLMLSLGLLLPGLAFGQGKEEVQKARKATVASKKTAPTLAKDLKLNVYERRIEKAPNVESQLSLINKFYTENKIRSAYAWEKLGEIEENGSLKLETRVYLIQQLALILEKNQYPILSAIYASQAITASKNPSANDILIAWKVLYRLSNKYPIQNILEVLAENLLNNPPENPPAFGSDWNYFTALAFLNKGDNQSAIEHLRKLNIKNRLYMPARYQEALIYIELNDLNRAIVALKSITDADVIRNSPMLPKFKEEMRNYALLGLGRVYYEKKEFTKSIAAYRAVNRESIKFHEALFEQSWAFFMAGYPNHALGGIYSMETPFFNETFHPESGMLESIVYYWMCRYDDSRHALARFYDKYSDGVTALNKYMTDHKLDHDLAYQLFEKIATRKYDEKGSGIPKAVLESASQKDSMLLLRDQYATLLEEKGRLEKRGIFKSFNFLEKPRKYISAVEAILVKKIGLTYQAELSAVAANFKRLNEQAEFLYVELLMSEKEKIMGNELHSSSKINTVSMKKAIKGWGGGGQNWNQSTLSEFWWDEVGYYIYSLAPTCKASH